MSQIRILVSKYLDAEEKPIIGGVESYISALCQVGVEAEYTVTVYQTGQQAAKRVPMSVNGNSYLVVAVRNARSAADLLKYIENTEEPDYQNDIVIFATDYFLTKNKFKKTIAIQHGVAWDITKDGKISFLRNCVHILSSALRAIKKQFKYRYCKKLVCVDYNFVNWYRTQVVRPDIQTVVIPNFSATKESSEETPNKHQTDRVFIIFARRLVSYRGTRLFAEAIRNVLPVFPNVSVTVAGVGPDEKWMQQTLEPLGVEFTSFQSKDSVQFHSKYQIAVIPTIGSEGTSLSLLEAMAAGCAVIATNVGGMTNIVLDGYNGLMIDPDVEALTDALQKLISDRKLREFLAKNAQNTVAHAFSFERWREKWVEVLSSI